MKNKLWIILLTGILFTACHRKTIPEAEAGLITETGIASYYADQFEGRSTASGEIFRQSKLTAAHKKIPFGTMVKVTNLSNHKTVTVRVNDRGPYVSGRIIDLSKSAAMLIGLVGPGIAKVQIEYRKK